MFLNADVPHFSCFLRKEYLYDLGSHFKEFINVVVFGVASIQGRAILFHTMTENGAQIGRLPISALVWKKSAPNLPLSTLELWDCFSYDVSVYEYEWLQGLRCRTLLRNRRWYRGEYLFTIDWAKSKLAEDPGDNGWKCAHILKLDNGCFAAQPNNRIYWRESAFITKPLTAKSRPDYLTNTHVFKAETESKWATENTNKFFYRDVEVKEK